MFKIGIADPFRLGESEFEMEKKKLSAFGIELKTFNCFTEDDIISQMQDCNICAVVSSPFTRRVIENLPKCKGILRYGIGVDNIDIEAATEKGIQVCYEPRYCVEDVATQAFSFIFTLSRKICLLDKEVRKGNWSFKAGYVSRRIQGKTLGLVGFGNISRKLASMMLAFDMNIIAYDPFITDDFAKNYGANKVNLETLIRNSDYISIHCPLTEKTKHLFSENEFKMMKNSAFIINTSRGAIIDTNALINALNEKQISGAALDVHEFEPLPTDHPLCKMNEVILTPHSGFYTEESFMVLRESIIDQGISIFLGEKPKYLINP